MSTTTHYVRDAAGQLLSVYTDGEQKEVPIYGSSRLGVWYPMVPRDSSHFSAKQGEKSYELSNHLGNVYVTFTDKKLGYDPDTNGVVDYYLADVLDVLDYYPYGSAIGDRSYYASPNYRFGFNGMEREEELYDKDSYTTLYRMYDSRIGRWFSEDPRSYQFREQSVYHFSFNSPIRFYDPYGDAPLDEFKVNLTTNLVQIVSNKGGSGANATHYYTVVESDTEGNESVLESYTLRANKIGLVQFPENGPNWGRFGDRDSGGDNWAGPEVSASLFGLFHDWGKNFMGSEAPIYFNDISASDGRDIRHKGHRSAGNDIDIRYFFAKPDGAGSARGTNVNCETCWNTVYKKYGDALFYYTHSFLEQARDWGFTLNYIYPQGGDYKAFNAKELEIDGDTQRIHADHMHLGYRKDVVIDLTK